MSAYLWIFPLSFCYWFVIYSILVRKDGWHAFLNLLRLVLCYNMFSVLENVPCVFAKMSVLLRLGERFCVGLCGLLLKSSVSLLMFLPSVLSVLTLYTQVFWCWVRMFWSVLYNYGELTICRYAASALTLSACYHYCDLNSWLQRCAFLVPSWPWFSPGNHWIHVLADLQKLKMCLPCFEL